MVASRPPAAPIPRLRAWVHRRWDLLFDALVVLGLLLGTVVTLRTGLHAGLTAIHDRPPAPTGAATLLATAAQAVPLLWRRRHPVAVLAVILAATVVVHLLNAAPGPANFGLFIALFSAAALARTRRAFGASAVVAVAGTAADFAVIGGASGLLGLGVLIAVYGAFWLAGTGSRARRLHVERLEAQARHVVAEQRRAEQDAARERVRLAREVHDAVTSQVTSMVVQAAAGRVRLRDAPPEADGALEEIARTGRRTLAELRGVLGLLRGADPPTPLLSAGLDALVERARTAGGPVEVVRRGTLDDLPSAVDAAGYRLVQEALTNAVRHAGGWPVSVLVQRADAELRIEVNNPLPPGAGEHGAGERGTGHGLLGMRERADLLGGELRAGPDRDRFTVCARVPIPTVA